MSSGQGKTTPRLRFPMFKHSWEEKQLGEFMEFKNGINADKSQYGSGRKFINVLDIIANNPITYESIIGYVDVPNSEFEKNEVVYGDVLFQRSSEIWEEAGQSNIYLDNEHSATFGGFVIRGRPIVSFDPVFFNYLLKTSAARKEIITKSGGSTRFNVGQKSLSEVSIQITPNSNEQRKIAGFLGAVDGKLEKLRRKRELLAEYKRGVMQQIFSQQIRFRQDDGRPFPNWEKKTLSQVLIPDIREVAKPSTNYLALGVRSHMKGTFQKPDSDPNSNSMDKLFVVRAYDLVVNITFAWEGAIAIAGPRDDGGLVSHRFPTYRFKPKLLDREFFRYVIQLERFKHTLGLISPGGAGRNRVLSKRDFLKTAWLFPTLKEQEKIGRFLNAIDNKIAAVDQQIEQMETFKKGLLQQMFV